MAGDFRRFRGQAPKTDMNVVPLVDVMLVLLVIFMVTAPLLNHAVKIDLPKASSRPLASPPERIELGLRDDGTVYWNGTSITAGELQPRMLAEARKTAPPELLIRADRHLPYEQVAQVMAMAARSGLTRIGFIMDPDGRVGAAAGS